MTVDILRSMATMADKVNDSFVSPPLSVEARRAGAVLVGRAGGVVVCKEIPWNSLGKIEPCAVIETVMAELPVEMPYYWRDLKQERLTEGENA